MITFLPGLPNQVHLGRIPTSATDIEYYSYQLHRVVKGEPRLEYGDCNTEPWCSVRQSKVPLLWSYKLVHRRMLLDEIWWESRPPIILLPPTEYEYIT